ncbi:MAG: YggS family pyridoxal phosphate-dependent enzyme [Flavobacteriales bacterium]|nr:YggS family pyridoxal phosphate-dependent enzyme [Flavobacteriales bacterium]MCX7650996.1 YggS family pyridoxal phosphate-dependent enzyme [Flavobacteriales bacterium]MDW8432422.1 YggS family pyridoxal phosphate-dependent enzyme [Flavobacteriales bacterium]
MIQGFLDIRRALPDHVGLVAVSKNRSPDDVMGLYRLGQRDFGENRVQELLTKMAVLPSDIRWHLIGHLQTNKVKYVAGKVFLIHSVDSEKLLDTLQHHLSKSGLKQDILLQVHIAQEESKYGFAPEAVPALLRRRAPQEWPCLRIRGLMGMATLTDNKEQVRSEFRQLSEVFGRIRKEFFSESPYFNVLSMGMSSDWPVAVEEGATLVRIGTALFAE